VAGKVGVAEAVNVIRQKVYKAIARTWPEMEKECRKQLRKKREHSL
jgi:hypothetical protein